MHKRGSCLSINTLTTLRTSVRESPACMWRALKILTATLKCICNDSLHRCSEGCQCTVVVKGIIWAEASISCCLMQVVFNTIISSLSVTRVTTLWLKQPPCLCSVRTTQRTVTECYRYPTAIYIISFQSVHGFGYNDTGADFLFRMISGG